MNEFALDPKLKVVAEVAKELGRTERRIQQMITAGDLAARKASDLEELALRKAGRIRSSTERGVWLIQQEAVQCLKQLRTDALTETTRSKVGYPKHRPRSNQSRLTTASEANRSALKHEPPWKVPITFTSLIGREQDVATIDALLLRPDVRLLTLLGVGGIGKTRLSLQIAGDMWKHFSAGVCFVSLAAINDPELVVPAIAQELGIPEIGTQPLFEQVKVSLQEKQLLLILDNFEQVVRASPRVEELLAACPSLKIVVTSRAVLHLQAEQEFTVPPLALPNLNQLPEHEVLSDYAAVSLFVRRAQAILPAFQVTPANARTIAEICVRLDGLPLAIELAAARIKLLPPQALLSRLTQRLQVLTSGIRTLPERQQTLRNTLRWSYDLLDPEEQRLFRRLSVFVGGCSLEAVDVVVHADREASSGTVSVLDGVASLLDNSLLLQVKQEGNEPRLIMLETVREYGLECLRESGEAEVSRRAHALYYLRLAEQAEPHLKGAQQIEWLRRLEQETANVSAVLEATFEYGMHAELVRGVYAFAPFLLLRGAYTLAERHLQRAREAAMVLGDSHSITTTLLYLGEIAEKRGNYTQAEIYLQEGLGLARELGDSERISALLNDLGYVTWKRGEYTQAEAYLQEGLMLARDIEDKKRISGLLNVLGSVVGSRGDYIHEKVYLQEGLAIARQIGDRGQICSILINLGVTAGEQGDYVQAEIYFQEGLTLARQIGDRDLMSVLLSNLGEVTGAQRNYTQAEIYFQEGLTLARQIEHREWISVLLSNLGLASWKQGNNIPAEEYFREGLSIARQIGRPQITANILYEYGNFCLDQQQEEAAEAIFQEVLTTIREGDQDLIALAQYGLARVGAYKGNIQKARKLGEASVTVLETIGHRQAKEVRVWLDSLPVPALSALQPNVLVKPSPLVTYPAGLTAREVEVLRLVAQGLTDVQVAEQLVISPHTVNGHLRSIYNKINVNSRSAATRYAIEHPLIRLDNSPASPDRTP